MLILVVLLCIIIILLLVPRMTHVVEVPVTSPSLVHRVPEFRPPPVKQWKPPHFQQMGLLESGDGTLKPLYGKETMGHKDRYHYYTTTSGNQIYPIPLSKDNRDCLDDIGCGELYGNESVNMLGKEHKVHMFRNV